MTKVILENGQVEELNYESSDEPTLEELKVLMEKSIVKVLLDDGRTMSEGMLKHRTMAVVRETYPEIFIEDRLIIEILHDMQNEMLIGKNKIGKYYIDYLNYPNLSDQLFEGYIHVDKDKGTGFITVKKSDDAPFRSRKATHYVHKKNLNGAQNNDLVEFVELDTSVRKTKFESTLRDAKVTNVLVHKYHKVPSQEPKVQQEEKPKDSSEAEAANESSSNE